MPNWEPTNSCSDDSGFTNLNSDPEIDYYEEENEGAPGIEPYNTEDSEN